MEEFARNRALAWINSKDDREAAPTDWINDCVRERADDLVLEPEMADPVLERDDEDPDEGEPLLRREKWLDLGLRPTKDVLWLGAAERSPIWSSPSAAS